MQDGIVLHESIRKGCDEVSAQMYFTCKHTHKHTSAILIG